jgi:lipopolysaccharide export system protein LptA
MRKVVLFAAICGFATGAAAQGSLISQRDADKPVEFSADKSDIDIKGKSITYIGNVIAIQGQNRLRADTMKADDVAKKVYVNGKVVVDSPTSGTVTGDNGIYDLNTKLVTLSGHVVLHKQGQVTMQGSLLTVNMVTGIANLGAGPVARTANQAAAPGAPGGRVTGVIIPKSAQTGGQ